MYASFQPSAGVNFQFSDPANVEEDFIDSTDDSAKEIQVAATVRAGAVQTFDRGNFKFHRTWQFEKQFATIDKAEAYLNQMRNACNCLGLAIPSGTLTLTVRNFDGTTKSATVQSCNVQIKFLGGAAHSIGPRYVYAIEATGGAMSAYN